jgi:tetratricopeptide (TPR) repeat protein
MKRRNYFNISLFLCLVVVGISCSRKVNPSSSGKTEDSKFDEGKFSYYYVEGIKQKLMGNAGEALKYLEDALKINPTSDAAYYQIAQILAATGDISKAKNFLKKGIEIDSSNMWYLTMIADFYYQEKNIDSTIYYYEQAVKYFPDKEDLQLTLGGLYSENKNYEKAISVYDAFDRKYGVNENSTVSALKTLLAAGKYDEALVKAQSLINEYPDEVLYNGLLAEVYKGKGEEDKAKQVYTGLLERNPDNPQIQLALCDFLINEKNYSELFLLLNNIILNNNIRREEKIALFARLNETEGIVKGNSDDLLISLMVLEANYKNDDIIPLLRPDLLVKLQRLDEAEGRLEELISENKNNYYAWEKLLLAYNQDKDYQKLFIRGEECASMFNRSFLAKILYANAAMELKKYDVAIEELRKAEILAGNNVEFITQVLTMRADVYYRMKDYVKAFETFREALKQNNDDLTVINNYAYYLAEQNQDLKEAEEMAKKVCEKEKGNVTYLDTYAWVLYKRGKVKEAAHIMEEIFKSGNITDAEYYEHYGYILKKQNKCDKAVSNWNYAIKLDSTKNNLLEEINNCGK